MSVERSGRSLDIFEKMVYAEEEKSLQTIQINNLKRGARTEYNPS
jgi:hypothetical protein